MRNISRFIFLLLPLLAFRSDNLTDDGRVRTFMSGKIERWEVTLGKDEGILEAYLKDDPNRWTFEVGTLTGEVNTEFNDNLGSWEITTGEKKYKLKTWLTGSWHRWELSGGDLEGKTNIQTLYHNSWDNWQLSRDSLSFDITTYFGNSWDDWTLKGDLSKLRDGEKVTAFFIPVFVSRIYKKGLVK